MLVLLAALIFAQSPARLVAGGGVIEISSGNEWTPATRDLTINAGDRLRTGLASFAYVVLAPNVAITLGDDTEIEVRTLDGKPAVYLERGRLNAESDNEITIVTREGTLDSLAGRLDMQVVYRDGTPNVVVRRGTVRSGGYILRSAEQPDARIYISGRRQRYEAAPAYSNPWLFPVQIYVDGSPSFRATPRSIPFLQSKPAPPIKTGQMLYNAPVIVS